MASSDAATAAAKDLVKSAKAAKENSETAVKAGVKDSHGKIKEVAEMVLEEANKAADGAKTFVANAVNRAEDYAGKVSSSSNLQERLAKAFKLPDSSSSRDQQGFPMSIVSWCSNLCGSDKNYKELAGDVSKSLNDAASKLQKETAKATTSSPS